MRICLVGPNSTLAKVYARHRESDEIVWLDERQRLSYGIPGTLDGMVTFPATVRDSRLTSMSLNDWDIVIQNTLTSVAKAMMTGIPKLRDGSPIVVVGSIVGSVGGYGCANYAAAKAGLVGLVRSVSKEVVKRDIRINLLELGYVNIGMGARLDSKIRERVCPTIPLGRFAEPCEVCHAIDFLMEQTYMTGNVLTFAGGMR